MPENLTDADEVVILEDDEFAALCDRLAAMHPEAATIPPAILLAFAKLVLGFARIQRAEADRESLNALRESFAALDAISGPRLTPALRIGNMATTLGNIRNIVRAAIIKAESAGCEEHCRQLQEQDAEQEAERRMREAGPDLCDAVRRLLRHIPKDAGGCSLSDDERRARLALAKAEGMV